jgi:hypothetical protein
MTAIPMAAVDTGTGAGTVGASGGAGVNPAVRVSVIAAVSAADAGATAIAFGATTAWDAMVSAGVACGRIVCANGAEFTLRAPSSISAPVLAPEEMREP